MLPNTRSVIVAIISPRTRAAVLAMSPNTRSKAVCLKASRCTLSFGRRGQEQSEHEEESDCTEDETKLLPIEKKQMVKTIEPPAKRSPQSSIARSTGEISSTSTNAKYNATVSELEKRTIMDDDDGNNKNFTHGTQVTTFGAEFRIDLVI